MRIGLTVYGDLDRLTGGNLYDRKLVEHLLAAGHEVDVLSLPQGSYFENLARGVPLAQQRRWTRSGYDVLLQDELAHPSLVRFNRAQSSASRPPIVSIVHHLRASERWPEPERELYQRVEKRYLDSVDAFVYNSESTRESVELLLHRIADSIVATPGGDRLEVGLDRTAVQARTERPGPLRLLFVGNLIERKGLHVLLSALEELRDSDWRLDVVGSEEPDPQYASRCRERARSTEMSARVWFRGRLDGEELAVAYRESDVLVVPSSYEGFGIVYLEAMAFGLTVVGGAAGGSDEIVSHGINGLLVPPDDTFSLKTQLAQLMSDRELLTRLSLTAFESFPQHPGWAQSMSAIESFLSTKVARG